MFRKVTCIYNIITFDIHLKLYVILPLHILYATVILVQNIVLRNVCVQVFRNMSGKRHLKYTISLIKFVPRRCFCSIFESLNP